MADQNLVKEFLRLFDPENLHFDIELRILTKSNLQPLDSKYLVRFYDKDLLDEDFLAEGYPDKNGILDLRINPMDMHQGAEKLILSEFREKKPDIFFRILDGEKVIYTSDVIKDVDIDKASFSLEDGREINLGTIVVDL
ncbi:MAG: hypothetical protein RMJ53_07535 [Chitinophagales bacterium]|nr:hypothetical protein [Chitinophagales bacterium]MDW8274063.1 hypothetical protein [Chitinophagales bacterium]